jgi:transposase
MDAFAEYAKQRLKAGRINSVHLLSSLRQRGFNGSLAAVQRFVRKHRAELLHGKMAVAIPCGSSLLTDDHHWILRLMQGDITAGDLRTELGETLSIEDTQFIIETIRTSLLALRNRALVVAAFLKGIPARSAAHFLLIDRASTREYLKRFREGGLTGLFDLTRKEIKKADDIRYKDAVFKILHTPPQSFGFNRTTWRMPDLKQILSKQGLTISAVNIRQIIRKAGFRFRKAKKMLTSNDPDYRDKLRVITEILQNLKSDERFFSVDEYGPFSVKLQSGRSLVRADEIKTVPSHQKSKGSLIATAALELSENQVTHFYSERKNTDEMLKLLEILLVKYANQSCIYFSWDAASWHASKKLYQRVEEVNSDVSDRTSNPACQTCTATFLCAVPERNRVSF